MQPIHIHALLVHIYIYIYIHAPLREAASLSLPNALARPGETSDWPPVVASLPTYLSRTSVAMRLATPRGGTVSWGDPHVVEPGWTRNTSREAPGKNPMISFPNLTPNGYWTTSGSSGHFRPNCRPYCARSCWKLAASGTERSHAQRLTSCRKTCNLRNRLPLAQQPLQQSNLINATVRALSKTWSLPSLTRVKLRTRKKCNLCLVGNNRNTWRWQRGMDRTTPFAPIASAATPPPSKNGNCICDPGTVWGMSTKYFQIFAPKKIYHAAQHVQQANICNSSNHPLQRNNHTSPADIANEYI